MIRRLLQRRALEDARVTAFVAAIRRRLLRDVPVTLVQIEQADLAQLLSVARMYLAAFDDDEKMTLPERLALAEVERIVEQHTPGQS